MGKKDGKMSTKTFCYMCFKSKSVCFAKSMLIPSLRFYKTNAGGGDFLAFLGLAAISASNCGQRREREAGVQTLHHHNGKKTIFNGLSEIYEELT